jgi:hypothetical protein
MEDPGFAGVPFDDMEEAELLGHHLEASTAARLQSIAPEQIHGYFIGVDEQGAKFIDVLLKGWMHV